MPTEIGHWDNLAEAQKATQEVLIPGVIEEDIKRGGPIQFLPVQQTLGLRVDYLRETANRPQAAKLGPGGSTVATSATTYDKQQRDLSIAYIETDLDKFTAETYGGLNNYANLQFKENQKAMVEFLNDKFFYGDATYATGDAEPDGLHALAAAFPTGIGGETNGLNIEVSGALTIASMRKILRNMKYGADAIFVPHIVGDHIDAYTQEAGLSNVTNGLFPTTVDAFGREVPSFKGIPIIRTDFLQEETAETGEGSNARAKSSGAANWSIFFVKFGQVSEMDPGVGLLVGGNGMSPGEMFSVEEIDTLEGKIASKQRLHTFYGFGDGSIMSIGRIFDITDTAITA